LSDDLKNQKMEEARIQAVAEAKTKAEDLAKAAELHSEKLLMFQKALLQTYNP